jgi:DNA-binding NtrC family response regulator
MIHRNTKATVGRPSLSGLRILVVEDELTLRKRIVALLMQDEAHVEAVATIAGAREAVARTDFDQILLDVNLPDGNGLDLLRESIFPAMTSVVIMTAQEGIETALEALRNGAADYLVKPFDPFALPLIFDRCKQRREARRRQEHDHTHAATASKGLFFGNGLTHISGQLERILKTDIRRGHRPLKSLRLARERTRAQARTRAPACASRGWSAAFEYLAGGYRDKGIR